MAYRNNGFDTIIVPSAIRHRLFVFRKGSPATATFSTLWQKATEDFWFLSIESRVARENSQLSTQNAHSENGTGLAAPCSSRTFYRGPMTKGQRLLVGALALSLAVGLYILFFCPAECH